MTKEEAVLELKNKASELGIVIEEISFKRSIYLQYESGKYVEPEYYYGIKVKK